MVSKEDFYKVWENPINALNQFYYEHYELLETKERIEKAIEYIKEDIIGNYFRRYDDEVYKMCDDLLEILGGKEND